MSNSETYNMLLFSTIRVVLVPYTNIYLSVVMYLLLVPERIRMGLGLQMSI